MLKSHTAKKLYHDYVKDLPIIDYHCHLSPKKIAENKKFKTITDLWLSGDHYKWRAMRAHGVEECYITGEATDKDKFFKWAEVVPNTLGNPIYHWTHLELKKYFGIEELLNPQTAEHIWHKTNEMLKTADYSTQRLIERSNVEVICTTDDPTDSLEYHKQIKKIKTFNVKVLPTFRPDKGLNISDNTFMSFLETLREVTGYKINELNDFYEALKLRVDYFNEVGCRLADHGLKTVPYTQFSYEAANNVFKKRLNGKSITVVEQELFQTTVITYLAGLYRKRNWTMQIHFGAIRNNNHRMFEQLGPDTGFDSINDQANLAVKLNGLLNACEEKNGLPKTILYNLNPSYNNLVASTIQNFQTDPGIKGKIQFGSGWWFNDTKLGMRRQMMTLAEHGLLMHFVGMLTDSRSFISYSRHDYFRRILSNLIGEWVEEGEIPNDDQLLRPFIENICYFNAKQYFNF